MPDFSIALAFTAKDGVTSRFKIMQKGANKFGSSAKSSFKKAARGATGFGNVLKGILAAGVISKGIGLITRGVRVLAGEFVAFDQSIISATSKFKGLNAETEEGQKVIQQLGQVARKVGGDVEFTAAEAGAGLEFLAMAGFNAQQAMVALAPTANLATVANADLATATDIASDSLGAFGLMTDDTGQLLKNYTRLNDVMAKTMNSTNTDMTTLFESVKKGAPAFTAAGQSLESFGALAGIMANSGVKGAESGTQLRNIMLRLAKPTAEAQKVLNSLNIQTADAEGNFRDVVDILADFENGLKGMGTQQKSAALATVFGAKSVTGINVLLESGTKKIRDFRTELENAAGTSQRTAERMRTSIQNRLASLKSASIEFGFKFFDVFKNMIGESISSATNIIRNFNFAPIKKGLDFLISTGKKLAPFFVDTFFALVDVGKALFDIAKMIFSFFVPSAESGTDAIKGFLNFIKKLAKGVTGFLKTLKPILKFLKPLVVGIGIVIVAMKAWAIVQTVMNVLLTANPIGLIIVAIGALIAIVALVVQNFNKIVNAVKSVWAWFLKLLDNPFIAGAALVFAPFIAVPALIIKHWKPISKFFTMIWDGIVIGATAAGEAIKDGFIIAVRFLKKIFFSFASIIVDIFAAVANGILGFIIKVGKFLKIDVAGIENAVNKIKEVQQTIRTEALKPIIPAEAPNKKEDEEKNNKNTLDVRFINAPENTEISDDNLAPGVNVKLLGAN